jgi:hypothetical protein
MALSDDARRMVAENLREAWKRYVAVAGLALAILPVYELASALISSFLLRLAAVAGTIFLLVVAFLLYFMLRSLRRAYAALPPDAPTHRHLAEILGKFFGVQKKAYTIDCTVRADGSSSSTHDVELVAHANQITQIEYRSTTPSVPEGVTGRLEINAVARKDSGVDISAQVLRQDGRECYWSLNFAPALKPGQTIAYRFHQNTVPGAFSRSQEEMTGRGLECEFYSVLVTYPTDKLTVCVAFEKEISPLKMSYDVWLGNGRVRHMAEYAKIETQREFVSDRDQEDRIYGKLEIQYPIHGLRYVLTWLPPVRPHATRLDSGPQPTGY